MTTYQIESGIPIEKADRKGNARKSKYPFDDLEVGESFFVPATDEKPKPWKSFGPVIYWANRRFDGKVFQIHKFDDEERGLGARIWRKS
jgi:hypothetical protein